MFYRISIHLVKRRSTSFRTSVGKKLARSPGLEMQTRVFGISIDVLKGTTLHQGISNAGAKDAGFSFFSFFSIL
jgi:hypothetical protein